MDEVVPQYLLDDFKRFFRVTRTTFETICENVQMYQVLLPSLTGGREHIPIFKQLLIVLWYVASQETLNVLPTDLILLKFLWFDVEIVFFMFS